MIENRNTYSNDKYNCDYLKNYFLNNFKTYLISYVISDI